MATMDSLFGVLQFFAVVFVILAIIVFWNAASASTVGILDESSIGQNVKADGQSFFSKMDFILICGYIAIHLSILLLAFFLRTIPVMYFVGLILIAILIIVSAYLSNAYVDVITSDGLSGAALDIPKTTYILENLPQFEVIWGFLTLIVLYGFARSEGIL